MRLEFLRLKCVSMERAGQKVINLQRRKEPRSPVTHFHVVTCICHLYTVIASRAPHLLLEQSVIMTNKIQKSWTCVARQVATPVEWQLRCRAARLNFARAARALAGRYMCGRGVLSEYPAARARASYWFDNRAARSARGGQTTFGNQYRCHVCSVPSGRAHCERNEMQFCRLDKQHPRCLRFNSFDHDVM